MSFADSLSTVLQVGRRFHARRRFDVLAYVEFGPDNGAILIDLGEGGLGFQSVMPVSINQALQFKFKLPAASDYIEGYAEVAWMNESGKGGGLRFVELSVEACAQIRAWAGVIAAPEAGALQAGKSAGSRPAQESPTEHVPARSTQESTRPEASNGGHVPAQISEALAPAQSAPGAGLSPEAIEAPSSAEGAGEEVPADQAILSEALPAPELNVEITAADSTEPLATQVEPSPPAEPPIAATSRVIIGVSESTLPKDSERITDAVGSADGQKQLRFNQSARLHAGPEVGTVGRSTSNRSAQLVSGMAKTIEYPEPTAAAPGMPARNARVPGSGEGNLVPVEKRQRQQAPANAHDAAVRGSFVRQPEKPAPSTTEWPKPVASQGNELKPQATLAAQALKIGIGAAVGACLMLTLVFGVPSLVTRVQGTANARPGGSNRGSLPTFQVEVADLNNRRWILRSSGETGSPFSNTPSPRETQPAASARSESAKSSHSEDSADSSRTVQTLQPKLPRPDELVLSRPHVTQADEPSALLVAPSIFDGITPPIGSVSDRLATGGPEAPRIVQPEVQSASHPSALQAAVLVQRVAPIYPSGARESHLQGEVLVNATIGTDGLPTNLKVIKGDERLTAAALTAIRQWRYRPATLGGQPIETQIVITVSFELK
jgi:periplasmic protein TonB